MKSAAATPATPYLGSKPQGTAGAPPSTAAKTQATGGTSGLKTPHTSGSAPFTPSMTPQDGARKALHSVLDIAPSTSKKGVPAELLQIRQGLDEDRRLLDLLLERGCHGEIRKRGRSPVFPDGQGEIRTRRD